jgi:hypothetical protein
MLDQQQARADVETWLSWLPKPIILIQPGSDDDDDGDSWELYGLLLETALGSVVVLNSAAANRRLAHARLRYAADDWGKISTAHWWHLLQAAEVLVAFDPLPDIESRRSNIPTLNVWRAGEPDGSCMPGGADRQPGELVAARVLGPAAASVALVEYGGAEPASADVAGVARRMLAGTKYFVPQELLARDVQLQQFIDWCRQRTPISAFADRHTTFDRLLREAGSRFGEGVEPRLDRQGERSHSVATRRYWRGPDQSVTENRFRRRM